MVKKYLYIKIIVLVGSLLISCGEIPNNKGTANINLQLEFGEQVNIHSDELSKAATIQMVTVTISGDGMETISTQLDFDIDGGEASGSIEVPQGDEREFLIEGYDQNELLQFSGSATEDLWDDEVDVPISVAWITPDPVTLSITEYSSNSITLSWDASTADDFYFYLPMVSTSPNLSVNDWWQDVTITNRTETTLTIDGLDENTVYYVAIVVVDTENWYAGGSTLDYSNQNTILRRITTPELVWLYYDDDSFEDYNYSIVATDRFINYFEPPSYPCYIQSAWLNLKDNSGEDGNYKLVITDEEDVDLFVSSPLPTESGVNDIIWNLQWSSRAAGTISSAGFTMGIEYTTTNGWPEIGLDQSSNAGESYYIDSAENWYYIVGNLGINAIVQLGGSVDGDGLGKSVIDSQPTVERDHQLELRSRFSFLQFSDNK